MVTPLQSLRMLSSQYLLKAMRETEQQTQSDTGNPRSALLQRYGIDSASGDTRTQKAISALFDAMNGKANASTPTNEAGETVAAVITTPAFMKDMKQTLQLLAAQTGSKTQAESMLAALRAGTLTVSDPAAGIAIKAWDANAAGDEAPAGTKIKEFEQAGWNSFLKAQLKPGEAGATYARTAEGTYIDKATGNNAYFGLVGNKYVYFTWPPTKAA